MKLKNKVLVGLATTVLALTMMVSTAFAASVAPFAYPDAAGAATNNDVWVVLFGGTAATPLIDDAAVAATCVSVDITFTGNSTFDLEFISNTNAGWTGDNTKTAQVVDGSLTINMPIIGDGQTYIEAIINCKNKTEGALEVSMLEFKDAAGTVIATNGTAPAAAEEVVADDAAATTDVPKTGVVSMAIIFGLGATAFGTGASVLKKKAN